MSPFSIYLVGTDTEIGKTSVAEAMLQLAIDQKIRALPFKPAQSGQLPLEQSDAARLARAANLPPSAIPRIAPHRFSEDRAPGCIASSAFLDKESKIQDAYLQQAESALTELAHEHQSQWLVIEGAGGLQVPMPGGQWQIEWIRRLAKWTIIVAPVGLGTINHTLLTIESLRHAEQKVLGIAWTGVGSEREELARENIQIVTQKSGLPALSEPDYRGSFGLRPDLFPYLEKKILGS